MKTVAGATKVLIEPVPTFVVFIFCALQVTSDFSNDTVLIAKLLD